MDVDEDSDPNLDLNPNGHARIYVFKRGFRYLIRQDFLVLPKSHVLAQLHNYKDCRVQSYDTNMRMIQ